MTSIVAGLRTEGVNRKIFRAAVAVSLSTVIVKLAGLSKEFVVAAFYGRSDALEAFLAAAVIPGLLINLIAESTNQSLIPALARVREEGGRRRVQQLLSNVMFWNCMLLVGASVAMGLSARVLFALIASHFAAPKLDLTVHMFYALLPTVALTGMASTYTAVLNTDGEFGLPALVPVVTPLLFVVFIPVQAPGSGAWAMVYAMLCGSILQVIWIALRMRAHGFDLELQSGVEPELRRVGQQFWFVMLSGLVASGGLLVDQSMAAMLPAGSVAALAYGTRFVSVALALLGGAVSSAITPAFSEMLARCDWDGCRRTIRTWSWAAFGISAIVCCGLIAGSRVLVGLTLQHGAFKARDSEVVSAVLVMYALQIPFFVSSRVYYRFLVAAGRTRIVFLCGLLNLVLDVALNLILMPRLGVAGIALASSLWGVSTFFFLWYWSGKVLKSVESLGADESTREALQGLSDRGLHSDRERCSS